jgi:hypothetical protein
MEMLGFECIPLSCRRKFLLLLDPLRNGSTPKIHQAGGRVFLRLG